VKSAAKGDVGSKASGKKIDKKGPAKTEAKSAASTKVDKKGKAAKAVVEPKKPTGKTTKSSSGRSRSGSKEAANPRSVAAAAVSRSEAGDSGGYMFINGRRVRMISTKGLAIPKRAKAAPVEEVAPEVEAERIRAIKTKLSESELTKYRELLLEKRRELVGVVNVMEEEALRSSGGNLSNMPLHMADVGSDTYDQDFTLGMAEAERRLLSEIDAAIGRIADRSYGVCQMTGKPIPKVRLNAKPWAKYTIEAARLVEAGQAR
jgi:RNA polymerase-binding protein DksA